MVIEEIYIKGFRNLLDYRESFSPSANLIYGKNGAGKTSILESIFLLAFGKSFLNRKKKDLVNDKSSQFNLHLVTSTHFGKDSIQAHFKNKFTLQLNQKKTNIVEINKYLYPVFFSSSDYNLYIENKPFTRKMIDRFIFGVDSLYLRYLLSYNRCLRQKNHLLKITRNTTELTSWNKILSELAEKLVNIKMKFIDMLNIEIENKFHHKLMLDYIPSLSIEDGVSESNFFNQLENLKQKELLYKRSLAGPHLDRFIIYLDSKQLGLYSSGEKKINLLMIYISFIELFKELKNQYPIFLIDDFDTAMDEKNIDFLIQHYPEMQVLATSVNKHPRFDRMIQLNKEN